MPTCLAPIISSFCIVMPCQRSQWSVNGGIRGCCDWVKEVAFHEFAPMIESWTHQGQIAHPWVFVVQSHTRCVQSDVTKYESIAMCYTQVHVGQTFFVTMFRLCRMARSSTSMFVHLLLACCLANTTCAIANIMTTLIFVILIVSRSHAFFLVVPIRSSLHFARALFVPALGSAGFAQFCHPINWPRRHWNASLTNGFVKRSPNCSFLVSTFRTCMFEFRWDRNQCALLDLADKE